MLVLSGPMATMEGARGASRTSAGEQSRARRSSSPKTSPDRELALRLYRQMVLTRAFDERALSLQRQGRLGLFPPCQGQEAAQVGAGLALEERDWLFPTYRDHGAQIAKEMDLEAMLLVWRGHPDGGYIPEPHRVVNVNVPIGTQVPQAAGFAYALKARGEQAVVMTFFGDGASSQGDVHEGMNFAGVFKLPVVFVCVNNQWAISVPVTSQTAATNLADRARGYGFDGVIVDGNDALAVYEVARGAVEKARAGGGPTLIEAKTYRVGQHATADDPARYRTSDVVEPWLERDPIKIHRAVLAEQGWWNDEQDAALLAEARELAARAGEAATSRPIPDPGVLLEHVYGNDSQTQARHRRALAALPRTGSRH